MRELVFEVKSGLTTYRLEKEVVDVPARGRRKASKQNKWYVNGHLCCNSWRTGGDYDKRTLQAWADSAECSRVEREVRATKLENWRTRLGITDERFEPCSDFAKAQIDLQLSLTIDQAMELQAWLQRNGK